jgi:hypothetical protein
MGWQTIGRSGIATWSGGAQEGGWVHKVHQRVRGFFFFGRTRVWTQGLTPAMQALYYLSHASSPFFSGYFGCGRLAFCSGFFPLRWVSQTFLPGTVINLTSASHLDYRCKPLGPAAKLFCRNLQWCVRGSTHLSKPTKCYSTKYADIYKAN